MYVSCYSAKNCLVNLKGIEELTKLYYIKFGIFLIYVDENNIVSLTGLRKLVSLTYVSGNINSIDSLDGLEKLTSLGSLSLCQNKIVSIAELRGLARLKRIYLRKAYVMKVIIPSKLLLSLKAFL